MKNDLSKNKGFKSFFRRDISNYCKRVTRIKKSTLVKKNVRRGCSGGGTPPRSKLRGGYPPRRNLGGFFNLFFFYPPRSEVGYHQMQNFFNIFYNFSNKSLISYFNKEAMLKMLHIFYTSYSLMKYVGSTCLIY